MPCYRPRTAYVSHYVTKNLETRYVFNPAKADHTQSSVELPCGKCIGCRLDRAKDWALRCHHESIGHLENAFITLTYDDHHLPEHKGRGNLEKEHFQKFIRSLRKTSKKKIRYYMCGEYGETCPKHNEKKCKECGSIHRPHYHALLFGYAFPDSHLKTVRNGNKVYTSKILSKHWEHGSHEIGDVNFNTAAYTARYILKKQTGPGAAVYKGRLPPYTQMSLRPGIGKKWYEQNKSDLYPHDFAVLPNGKETSVPRYYAKLLKKEDPGLYDELRLARLEKAKTSPDNTDSRLQQRETCAKAKNEKLVRNL